MKKAILTVFVSVVLAFGSEDNNATKNNFEDIGIVKQTALVVGFPLIVAGGVLTAVLTPIVYAPVELVKWIASNSETKIEP